MIQLNWKENEDRYRNSFKISNDHYHDCDHELNYWTQPWVSKFLWSTNSYYTADVNLFRFEDRMPILLSYSYLQLNRLDSFLFSFVAYEFICVASVIQHFTRFTLEVHTWHNCMFILFVMLAFWWRRWQDCVKAAEADWIVCFNFFIFTNC